jgi:hypothetical protein
VATSGDHGGQTLDEHLTFIVAEDMKQCAVEHGFEPRIPSLQCERVGHHEPGGQAALARLVLGHLDRCPGHVDAYRIETPCGRHESVLTGPATHIQDAAL